LVGDEVGEVEGDEEGDEEGETWLFFLFLESTIVH